MTAEQRDYIDEFIPVAHAAGLGQAKFQQAVGWTLTGQAATEREFRDRAIAAGWSDRHIEVCLNWANAQKQEN